MSFGSKFLPLDSKITHNATMDSAHCSGPDEKIPPLQEPIRYQDLLNSACSQAEKKIKLISYIHIFITGSSLVDSVDGNMNYRSTRIE